MEFVKTMFDVMKDTLMVFKWIAIGSCIFGMILAGAIVPIVYIIQYSPHPIVAFIGGVFWIILWLSFSFASLYHGGTKLGYNMSWLKL